MNKRLDHVPERLRPLRQARMEQLLSLAEFGKKYGFHVNTVSNWEQGRSRPQDVGVLMRYAKALGFKVSQLIDIFGYLED